MKRIISIIFLLSIMSIMTFDSLAGNSYGGWMFREGNRCTQGMRVGQINKDIKRLYKNDEARSVDVLSLPAGSTITVYDDKEGRWWKDDWAEITVKKNFLGWICVETFEKSGWYGPNQEIYVTYHKMTSKGNLDGKVSFVRYYFPPVYYNLNTY